MYFDFFNNDPFWGAQDYYGSIQRMIFWVIGLIAAAVVLGIVLNFTFLKKSNEGKFKGIWRKLYDTLSMNRFYTEDIVKLVQVITFLILTFLGLYMIFTGSIVGGLMLIIFGNLMARLCYELIIMFAILARKTVSMDKRLSGIEKFYSDDMKDWEGDEASPDESFGDDLNEDPAEKENGTFEDRLKEVFGDLEDKQEYGYDEECRECDNWDEESEDCFCEDDCLTCDKPDQDAAKAEAAADEDPETAEAEE